MNNSSLKDIEYILKQSTYEEFIELKDKLREDGRKHIINLIARYDRKFNELSKEVNEYNERRRYEEYLFRQGYRLVAGIDEVGRGPLAGPVYAAAVILDPGKPVYGVKDSKKLSASQRKNLSLEIREKCTAYSIGISTVEEIDRINILNATKLAMKRAVDNLHINPDHLLIDALRLEDMPQKQTPVIKGDDLSVSIGAASIIAKVERDNYMESISENYPQYALEKNKGYGTKEHIEAIIKYGPADIHRKTFIGNFTETKYK